MKHRSVTGHLLLMAAAIVVLVGAAVAVAGVTLSHYPRVYRGGGLIWSAVLLGLAVLMVVVSLLWLRRGVIRPMRRTTAAIRRLTGGEREIRAPVAGGHESRQLAAAVNEAADAAERLRADEAERDRLMRMARATVQRIREHLQVDEVLREARLAIEQELDADVAYLPVIEEGEIGPAQGPAGTWRLPSDFIQNMPQEAYTVVMDLLARQASLVIQDVQGPEGEWLPPELREPLRAAGITSHLLTPFGDRSELFGVIAAERMRPDHPWTPAEVEALEWIAGDLAQGLRQARMYEAENRLVVKLRALDRTKSDFLATVSHELRTPLTNIAGNVELLSGGDPGPLTRQQRRMLDAVERNTHRLRHLIEDLLTLSKIETGAFKTAMRPVDLARILTAGAGAWRPEADRKGLALTATAEPASVPVSGDPVQLERMLLNVVSNAVKFTPAGGRVEVALSVQDGSAVLRVTDTGIGIPEAEQPDLSSRFFRASNAVAQSIPGTGLGLTIVRSIVANHSGDLDVRSREGQGTTVTIRLPLRTAGAGGAPPEQGQDQAGQGPPPPAATM